jgi:hypothetical protein
LPAWIEVDRHESLAVCQLRKVEVHEVNAKNFYIVATAPNEPSLQVRISGPYLTKKAAQADLAAAIDEAMGIDPSAKDYRYSIAKVESRKPGVIQHMAAHAC